MNLPPSGNQNPPIVSNGNATPANPPIPIPQTAPTGQTAPVVPQQEPSIIAKPLQNPLVQAQTTEEVSTPFYSSFLFWIFLVLMAVFGGLSYGLIQYLYYPPLTASIEQVGDVIRVKVTKLKAPTYGFLVVQTSENHQPGKLDELSGLIFPSSYNDFYLTFNYDQNFGHDYFANLVKGDIYVTFYESPSRHNIYDATMDNKVAKDFLGRKLQIILENGKQL